MRTVVFGFLLLIFSQNIWAVGCGQPCNPPTIPCDGGCATCLNSTCQSCCEVLASDEGECQDNFPGCHWNGSQCEDIVGAGCANGIPEAPMSKFRWSWLGLASLIVGLSLWWSKRRPKASY